MEHASLTYCVKQQYSLDHIPTLFVATKSDLDLALQVSKFLGDIAELWMLSLGSET